MKFHTYLAYETKKILRGALSQRVKDVWNDDDWCPWTGRDPCLGSEDLGLKPGDQLVVLGKFSKFLGLIKIDEMAEFAKQIMDHVAGTDKEEEVKEHMKKTLNAVLKEKKS